MSLVNENLSSVDQESEDAESSDIAESTEVSDEDSSGGSISEDDDCDAEEEDVDVEQLSSGSSDATEYDSSSVWSEEEDDVERETTEATEAAIMIEFQRALDLILNEKQDRAKKIFTKLLKQPPVAKHKTTKFIWENDATDNNHLNKMGRVFVAAHKNLAAIDEKNAIEHYLQVVGIAPGNDEIWFALGQKLVENGDLDMAIYAFEQISDWRAEEALMSTHFLKKNYKTTLQYVAAREKRLGSFRKGDFLKNEIASKSQELHEYVRHLFEGTSFVLDPKYENEVSSRLSVLKTKIQQCVDESREGDSRKEELVDPIKISLSADQSVWDIMTVFCDLFDRIQAYSEVFSQRILIEEWECREDKLVIENVVERLVDDVIAVENTVEQLVEQISIGTGQETRPIEKGRVKNGVEGKSKSRRGQRDGDMGRGGESSCDEEERPTSVDSVALREPSALEDVVTYYLDARPVRPLREGMSQGPSRMSATPGAIGNEEDLLVLLKEALYEERYLTIVKALEYALYSTVVMDCLPSRSSHQSEMLIQVYRRWTQCSPHLLQPHQLSIHAFMTMYNDPLALDYCTRVVHSTLDESADAGVMRFPEKRDLIRFLHKRVQMTSGDAEGIKWLKFMAETIQEEEAFNIVGGIVSRDSINEIVEKKLRAHRIRSLKHLSAAQKWDEIVSIVESDSQWSHVEDDHELSVRTRLYTRALVNLEREERAAQILNRMLLFLLSQPSLPATTIRPWIKLLNAIQYSSIPSNSKTLPSLGYSLLRLTEHSHLARDWKLWRVLHQVIKRIEESRPNLLGELFNESLVGDEYNRSEDYDELPLRSLRFLVHAHDRMASIGVCGQDNGAFLSYSLAEFRVVMEKTEVKDTLRWRKLQWLMSNVQAEVYQLLHCAFGRYSKKKRAAEDHETGVEMGEEKGRKRHKKTMEDAIALSIPNPIPEFDDKGVVGVDLVDLIMNRFPSFVRIGERREKRVNELKKWIERGPVCNGNLREGERRDEKMKSLLLEWPHGGVDSKLESIVFYLLALHYHRQSKQDEARQFAEYFLSSNHVRSFGDEVAKSAWVILSYATIERMFKLYDDDLLAEMAGHIRPLRVALEISRKSDATVHFLLAQCLYQSSTRLARYLRKNPSVEGSGHSMVSHLREECVGLFEKVLEVAPSMQEANQSAWDFQWLAYFFLAKLHLKGDNPDVAKAVDGFFEAACALQMGGAAYLQKISVKNQKNLEPVEVHYQLYSTVWKYITRSVRPSFSVLVRLRAYTDAFSRHGVVKPSAAMDLYELEPVISEIMHNISFNASRNAAEEDVEFVLNNILDKVELIEELKAACKEAFKLIVDRFPHRKALHRLAEISVREGDLLGAHTIIFKKIFPRKKKEDSIFEGVIEFSSSDIDRSDSLSYHVTRSLRLGLSLSVKIADAASITAVCTALAKTIMDEEESYVLKSEYMWMIRLATRALSLVLSSHPLQWNRTVKSEIVALHKSLLEVSGSLPLVYLRGEVKKIVERRGGMARLEGEVATWERKPSQQRKRKAEGSTDKMLGGLLGQPVAKMMNCPSMVLKPVGSQSSGHSPQKQAILNLCRSLNSSPGGAPSSSSLPSSSTSPISDPNRLLFQMLLQQAAAQSPNHAANANAFANLFSKK